MISLFIRFTHTFPFQKDSIIDFATDLGKFTFFHLLVIGKRIKILQYIIEKHQDLCAEESLKSVRIENSGSEYAGSQDRWIFGASSIHLAAKFMPEGTVF